MAGDLSTTAAAAAAALTPETVDPARAYTLEELAAMPAEALEELWLACPERAFYEAALAQAVADTYGPGAAAGDRERLAVIEQCLLYYTGQHPGLADAAPRIPALQGPDGAIAWFKVPDRVREGAEVGGPDAAQGAVPGRAGRPRARLALALAGGLLGVLCAALIVARALPGGGPGGADLTAAAAAGAALPTPSPTPLALEDLDRPIRAGEDLRGSYPVLLELAPVGSPPRVFPVQQRAVEVADWGYDPDPDVASAVLGLVVRPVLGIPYTAANAASLAGLAPGDAIRLRMSTGQVRAYRVTGAERVGRQAVALFDQSTPGIAVVLLGDPAPDRLVVHGEYLPGQEAPGPEAQMGEAVPEGAAGALGEGLTLRVLGAAASGGPAAAPLPEGWRYLLVDLELAARAPVEAGGLVLELVDAGGARYAPAAVDRAILRYPPLQAGPLAAGETRRATAAFLVPWPAAAPVLAAHVGEAAAHFALEAGADRLTASDLEVALLAVSTQGAPGQPGELVVSLRLYNPHGRPISVLAADAGAVFSPVVLDDVYPVGAPAPPVGGALPLVVEPGQALDVALRFPWPGDPYVGLQVGGYRFAAVLR